MGSYSSGLPALFARQHAAASNGQTTGVEIAAPSCNSDPEAECQTNGEDIAVEAELPRSRSGKRALQNVSTKQERQRVVKWMKGYVDEVGTADSICAITVRNFPAIFCQANMNANLQKASRWWKARETILAGMECESSFNCVSHRQLGGRKKVMLKAEAGRGRKREAWSTWLYPHVLNEFRRLRAAGVKFSPDVLRLVAQNVLRNTPHPIWSASFQIGNSGMMLVEKIDRRWIQCFQDRYSIVCRLQTGKLSCGPAKQMYIDRSIAYHLGVLCRGFQSGVLDENLMENVDETHFAVNMDNGRTLGFRGDKNVKYADVVSGGVSMTMVVKVTGGRAGRISTPFMIFQNENCSYSIRGVPDNVPSVAYRTTKKSFMTSDCFVDFYKERRVSWADTGGATKIQWIDNVSSHNLTQEVQAALSAIRTQVRYLPENSTHVTQPCDTFIISKIKDAWTRMWKQQKIQMILENDWQGNGESGTSGLLRNPGKIFFLQLAAAAVREVNQQMTKQIGLPGDADYIPPITYARKAMILCGLSLNTNGEWSERQLSAGLQTIISQYRSSFVGSHEGIDHPFTIDVADSQLTVLDSQHICNS